MAHRNEGPFPVTAGEALEADRLVKLTAGSAYYADAGDEPIGVTADPVASGGVVSCYPLRGGIERVTAAKSISSGAGIYVANDGKVSDAAVGTQIGLAGAAATADGGKIPAFVWGPRGGSAVALKHQAQIEWHEDFVTGVTEDGHKFSETADKGDWLKSSTDTDGDGGDVCQVADDAPGGILQVTVNDNNSDLENVQLNGEPFKLAGKELWFEADVALLDIDKCDFFIGLAVADVDILGGVTDRVGFQNDHDGNLQALCEKDSTETKEDSGADIEDCAAIGSFASKKKRLTFHWDGSSIVTFYVDGVEKKQISTNVPDDEALAPALAIKPHTGAGAVQTAWIDRIAISADR